MSIRARLEGKVSIITGGASGIGLATSLLFSKEGAKTVIADLDIRRGQKALNVIRSEGGDAVTIQCDVSKSEDVEKMVNATVEMYGRLDVLVNNAGIYFTNPVEDATEEEWDKTLAVNLKGVFLCTKHAVQAMRKHGGGAIINIASIAGMIGYRDSAAYDASKGGVIALTKSVAIDCARQGYNIRVNAICPGDIRSNPESGIRSHLTDSCLSENPEEQKRQIDGYIRQHPIGRMGLPEDIAKAALFLATDDAAFITGIAMPVDGGRVAE
jgi:NAD(P)-dependent dehydrogenase (short-subunit alcohol dehydrogenase family)